MNDKLSWAHKVKGEFEAEGLTREEVASEAIYAARFGLDYLVKISGCEALSDINYISQIGIQSLVCPMIESQFAMKKYMKSIEDYDFSSIGVTIETVTAVSSIHQILLAGTELTEVTVGRSDLAASMNIQDVECMEVIDLVVKVCAVAKSKGLRTAMGGTISQKTLNTLVQRDDLCAVLDYVETRKLVVSVDMFRTQGVLKQLIDFELDLLERKTEQLSRKLALQQERVSKLQQRAS